MRITGIAVALLSLAGLLCGGAASAKVGIASVVDGAPVGKPPASAERVLRVGIDMDANEKVTTKAGDRAHLVFLDGTSLTVGPNSEVVIDKFVYDPERKSGEMALSVTRGSLRFVGGVLSKKSEVKVTTPSATLGIRGGIFALSVTADGGTVVNFLFGISLSVTAQGETRTVTEAGWQVVVRPGEPPSPPTPIPPGSLRELMLTFEQAVRSNTTPGAPKVGGTVIVGQAPKPASDPDSPLDGRPTDGSQEDPESLAIRQALGEANFASLNSGLTPEAVLAGTPSLQELAALLTGPGIGPLAGEQPESGNPQGSPPAQQNPNNGPLEGATEAALDPTAGSGPLGSGVEPIEGQPSQTAGPLAGNGPLQGAGPLEASDGLGGNVLQGSGPLPSAGPLLGAGGVGDSGPLDGAGPLQGSAPISDEGALGGGVPISGTGPEAPQGPPVTPVGMPTGPAEIPTGGPPVPVIPPVDPPPPPAPPAPPTPPTPEPPTNPPGPQPVPPVFPPIPPIPVCISGCVPTPPIPPVSPPCQANASGCT